MTLKKVILLLFLIFAVSTGFFLQAANTLEKQVPVKPGQKLNVNLKSGGSLSISGWKENSVAIKVLFKNGGADHWKISVKKVSSGVDLESFYTGPKHKNHRSPAFEIKVPWKFDLKIKSMGGGITIHKVNGDITGKTMGGKLQLSGLKGFVNLKTMGGAVTLKDSDVDGKIKTMGGRVLFENVMGDVSGSSMGGNVIYKNVKSRTGTSTGKVVNISTMGGDINVSEALHGAKVHTMGGDIHVKAAKEFITAKTMGGGINIDNIDGWVKATTMGGDVTVHMTGDPGKGKRDVTLSSNGGTITLTVPKGLSMDIEIEIAYTKSSKQNYKITGDFDIKQKQTGEWDTSKGSPRKYIYGKGKTGDGKHKIKIKTINGNVVLKKN
jgi:DUF4097 and DUF4098 domain-containing protein YvlB